MCEEFRSEFVRPPSPLPKHVEHPPRGRDILLTFGAILCLFCLELSLTLFSSLSRAAPAMWSD